MMREENEVSKQRRVTGGQVHIEGEEKEEERMREVLPHNKMRRT